MSLAVTCQVACAPLAFHPYSHPPMQEVVNAQRSGEYGTGFQSFLIVAEAVTGLMCLFVIWRTRGLKQGGGGEVQLPRYAYFMSCVQRNTWNTPSATLHSLCRRCASLTGSFVWFCILKKITLDREAMYVGEIAAPLPQTHSHTSSVHPSINNTNFSLSNRAALDCSEQNSLKAQSANWFSLWV